MACSRSIAVGHSLLIIVTGFGRKPACKELEAFAHRSYSGGSLSIKRIVSALTWEYS